jgi:CubicO group peptidase (beta-lactamase class C family)
VDHWLDAFLYNPDARVGHVLGMVAHNINLALGERVMAYDTVGTTQINSLSDMLNAAIVQDAVRLGGDLEGFVQKFLFEPLGMTRSTWSGGAATKTFAFSWETDVFDMARLGLLMLNGGVWDGERILDSDWIHRMTHPSFEDANTGYGYLTWLNASSNHTLGGIPAAVAPGPDGKYQLPYAPGPCAPVSVYDVHPHGLSEAVDCNYAPPYSCDKTYDDGVWQAVGLGGQVIQGHPGLDLVLVVRDAGSFGPEAPIRLWDALRGAVIAADPTYSGDEDAFCAAYGANEYAPDLR